jgi:PAS domain S-box-containing protein
MGIWDWDLQHDELLTSASTRRIFGVEGCIPTQSSRDFMEYVHPEDRPRVRTAIRTAVTSRERFTEEFRVRWPDGTTRWVSTRGRVHTNAHHEPTRMIGTVIDVTDRKAADRALRDSEALNRAMLQAIPDLIFRFSSDGVYLNVEADQQDKLAQPIDQLLGRSIPDVLPPKVAQQWMTMIDDALATGTVQQGEYPLVTQQGEECIFEARVAPLNGCEVEAIVRDITERKRQQQRLVEAKERAEEMNRLKSAFLANMSHELRTPLTAILGFAEILSEEVSETNREFARLISQSGRRLMETLNSVLDLAQLESRSVALDANRTDVRERVEEALSMFALRASDQDIHLVADVPEAPIWAVIDPSALDRVLSNLISNALKFTPEGEVRVSVRATDGSAEIRVQDTGVGIDAAFLPHIFDEFRQESTGSSREFEGVGLGLTITKRLVEQMDGEIDVDSTKGEGTVFTVRLPCAASTVEETPADAEG